MFRRYLRQEFSPWQWCLVILALVFICEYLVMLLLPLLVPAQAAAEQVALFDACLLTLLLVPLFWWMIVRPLDRMARRRAELLEQFIHVQEDERGRIARDLHDEIGQSFTSVLLGLRTLDLQAEPAVVQGRLQELAGVVNDTLQEVRRLARGLRPSVLDHLGLLQAISQYVDDFRVMHDIEVEFHAQGSHVEGRYSPEIEIAVYRILQECLTNIARHAEARHARVELQRTATALRLQVTDDGRGFATPPELNHMRGAKSMGLFGITERVNALHGTLEIESQAGRGTRISLSIPWTEKP